MVPWDGFAVLQEQVLSGSSDDFFNGWEFAAAAAFFFGYFSKVVVFVPDDGHRKTVEVCDDDFTDFAVFGMVCIVYNFDDAVFRIDVVGAFGALPGDVTSFGAGVDVVYFFLKGIFEDCS